MIVNDVEARNVLRQSCPISFPEHCLLSCSLKAKNSFTCPHVFTEFTYLGLSLVQVLSQAGDFLHQVFAVLFI